ncbi:MAG: hypothetical protein Tsb0033_15350 [Winogradskyella sp.]
MLVLVIIIGLAFLYWSLVPKKPNETTLNDIIHSSKKRNEKVIHVYKNTLTERVLGNAVYYYADSPDEESDVKVFSGTVIECQRYINRHSKALRR